MATFYQTNVAVNATLKKIILFFIKFFYVTHTISFILIFLWSKSRRSRVFCYVRQPKHKKPSRRMAKGLSTNHKSHDKRTTRKISCGTLAAIFRCNTALCDIFRIQVPIHRIIMCLLSCSILFFRLSERK